MDELFEQFMIEGRELISKATDDLMALEEDQSAAGRVDGAFRAVHTLKGSVAIFDMAPMGMALHAAEDLLGSVRSAAVPMSPSVAGSLLACLDQCDRWMDVVEESGHLPPEAPRDAALIAAGLLALTGVPQEPLIAEHQSNRPWVADLMERHSARLEETRSAGRAIVAVRYLPSEDCFFAGDDPMTLVTAVPELKALDMKALKPWPPLEELDPYRCNLEIELVSSSSEAELRQLFRFIPDQVEIVSVAAPAPNMAAPSIDAERTIRVSAAEIDKLLDLVGELVVAKNSLAHLSTHVEAGTDPKAIATAIRAAQTGMERLVADMHRAVMNVRMVPLDRQFRRLTRMVRELSQRLDKTVAFEVVGEQTRIDKAVADALFEPLLHLVRNAVDHGIEAPETRRQSGKPQNGKLILEARTLGDQILIEIRDDGAGIDPARVRAVASERRLMSSEQLDAMDDDAAVQLIFAPGFSTSIQITDVSGRGVGMDAVKTAIERLGGRVTLISRLHEGTSVALRLPASAALTTVLLVQISEERFAIPLDTVVETVRIPRRAILPVGLGQAFVLRGKTLPLIELSALLGIDRKAGTEDARILVVDGGQGRIGIAVDDFSDRLDVMLRPMTGLLASVPGVSGTTLLGDGSVLLILNLGELIG